MADENTISTKDEIEALRDALSDGAFGTEGMADENDAVADESLVEDFISMFGVEGATPLKAHDWKAYVPSCLCEDSSFSGKIYGLIRPESESVYIFDAPRFKTGAYCIGGIGAFDYPQVLMECNGHGDYMVRGYFDNGELLLMIEDLEDYTPIPADEHRDPPIPDYAQYPVRIKKYDTVTNLFSRNTGLLESSAMLDKRAVLVGCGSVGSFVAMQLARSGVGKFVLCDTDTLEIHNICRHQCGFDDLGRYKVDAVKDKILNINPNAEVITYRSIIQRVPEDELMSLLGRNTIIIGGGDNRGSADWACKLAIKTDSTFVSTGCWTRAFAGEIFYWASGRNLSCYSCALGGLIDEDRPESHATYFGSDEEKETLSFEPGIAADIDFVTIIAVKLALDLLNRDNENYTPRVIDYLKQYTWVCNTNNTKIGGPRAAIFPTPLWITNNLTVNKDAGCPFCGNK